MDLVLQPPNSHICGQCCMAMVTGKPLKEVQKAMKDHKKGGTTPTDLIHALQRMGVKCRAGYLLDPNSVAIVCLKTSNIAANVWGGHWMVWNKGQVLDPLGFHMMEAVGMKFTYIITIEGV